MTSFNMPGNTLVKVLLNEYLLTEVGRESSQVMITQSNLFSNIRWANQIEERWAFTFFDVRFKISY